MTDGTDDSQPKNPPPDDVVLARRKLLKVVAYVAPAIVSTLAVRHASAQTTPSCGPSVCPPDSGCQPACGPSNCRPQG